MMLMPADTADFHSQVLWWRGRHHESAFLDGGLHFWKPDADSPTDPWTTNFTASRPIPIPGVDVFCASHDQLAGDGGRIFVAGGTETGGGETGTNEARVFNSFTRTWETPYPPTMSARRWYPTATAMGDGRIFVASGSSHFNFHLYGGLRTGEEFPPVDRQLHRYQIVAPGGRDPAVQPLSDPLLWPPALEGHSATYQQFFNAAVYFGGITGGGSVSSDTWRFFRNESDLAGDYQYSFLKQSPATSPPARSQHSAVVADDRMLIVWGGRTVSGLLSQQSIWIYDVLPGDSILNWRRIDYSGGPSLRYGHGAFFDPSQNRMLTFGGSTSVSDGTLADAVVWAFNFTDANRTNGTWSQPQVVDALGDGNPPALAEFGMIVDPVQRPVDWCSATSALGWNAILFGGRRGPHSAPDYSNDLWMLWSWTTGPDAGKLEWQKVNASGAPAARARTGLGYDASTGRLFVMGGRNATGKLADVTRINVHPEIGHDPCPDRAWVVLDSTLTTPVEGHSVLIANRASFSRTPEVFGQNQWTALPTASRLQNWYPFQFLRPYPNQLGQRIFTAGPDDTAHTIVVIDGQALVGPTVTSADPLIGGSAVMYAPGQIMKCGTRDAPAANLSPSGEASPRTQTIDADATSLAWVERDALTIGRVNHNLTLLPSGDVLITGGTRFVNNAVATGLVHRPQVWSPATLTWGSLLDSTTVVRDYHNTALLMPDGRVLAGGGNTCVGNPACTNDRLLDVFSPPYLYSGNDQRPRRTILGTDGVISLDDVFTVVTDSVAVDTVVLMRAGMVTHGFDAGQRIIRPVKQACPECAGQSPPRSKFKLPVGLLGWVDPREVPPGFYQLFAIKNGVPSIGRWMWVLQQGVPKAGKNDVGDRIIPAKTTLSVIPKCHTGYPGFTWIARADDSTSYGTLKAFDIRQASNLCTGCWSQFNAAPPVANIPTPGPPGTVHEMTNLDLDIGYTYKFQMVSTDDRAGRTSPLSNVAAITVFGCEEGMSGGGGGGGGGSSARRDALATAVVREASTPLPEREVTTLPGSPDAAATEWLPFPFGPRLAGDRLQAYLRRGEVGRSQVSGVQLVAVDAPSGTPLLTPAGRPLAGTRVAALAAERADGSSVMAELASDENPFAGRPGDELLVRLPAAERPTPVVIRALGGQSPELADYGITVEVPDGAEWREVGRIVPRQQSSDLVVEGIAGDIIRLSFKHPHAVSRIERLMPAAEAPVVHRPAFAAASHSGLGALNAAAFAVEGGITVAARETLTVDFAGLPEPAAGVTRAWYLEVTARHEQPERRASTARSIPVAPATAFAFDRARPNPTTGRTTFEFATPVACDARLELFDLLGRRVAVAHDAPVGPGRHAIEWNGADASGARVRAGLYVCRLHAGAHWAEKKLLIVP
jgi:hypothetical protein